MLPYFKALLSSQQSVTHMCISLTSFSHFILLNQFSFAVVTCFPDLECLITIVSPSHCCSVLSRPPVVVAAAASCHSAAEPRSRCAGGVHFMRSWLRRFTGDRWTRGVLCNEAKETLATENLPSWATLRPIMRCPVGVPANSSTDTILIRFQTVGRITVSKNGALQC